MQEIIDSEPRISRAKLSRQICEELGWRSRNGRLKEVSCRTALLKLHRRGAIRLQERLNQIVNNSRFLILPYVHVPHLASHVLGLALRRLRSDWRGRYGDEPSLVETFIEARRFRGTCYRAANFTEVGQTQGRGRQ